jgi:hypothetical protein
MKPMSIDSYVFVENLLSRFGWVAGYRGDRILCINTLSEGNPHGVFNIDSFAWSIVHRVMDKSLTSLTI